MLSLSRKTGREVCCCNPCNLPVYIDLIGDRSRNRAINVLVMLALFITVTDVLWKLVGNLTMNSGDDLMKRFQNMTLDVTQPTLSSIYTKSNTTISHADNLEVEGSLTGFFIATPVLMGNSLYQHPGMMVFSALFSAIWAGFSAFSIYLDYPSAQIDIFEFVNSLASGLCYFAIFFMYVEMIIRHLMGKPRSYIESRDKNYKAFVSDMLSRRNGVPISSVATIDDIEDVQFTRNKGDSYYFEKGSGSSIYKETADVDGESIPMLEHSAQLPQKKRPFISRIFLGDLPEFFKQILRKCSSTFSFFQPPHKNFYFPQRLIMGFVNVIWILFTVTIWLSLAARVIAIFLAPLLQWLLGKGTTKIIVVAIQYGVPAGAVAVSMAHIVNWIFVFLNYRKSVMLMRRGPSLEMRKKFSVYSATKYIGYQVIHTLAGFFGMFIIVAILVVLVVISVFVEELRKWIIHFLLSTIGTWVVVTVIQRIVIACVLLQTKENSSRIHDSS